jgi:hypothetical protein
MSDVPRTYEVNAQDVIDALIEQRNGVMNELARSTAALRALERQLKEASDGNASRLPAQPAGH